MSLKQIDNQWRRTKEGEWLNTTTKGILKRLKKSIYLVTSTSVNGQPTNANRLEYFVQ